MVRLSERRLCIISAFFRPRGFSLPCTRKLFPLYLWSAELVLMHILKHTL